MFKKLKKKIVRPLIAIYYSVLYFFFKKKWNFLYWYNQEQNFGDSINPLLIRKLTQKKVFYTKATIATVPHTLAIGSIVEHCGVESIIWGSGFISKDSALTYIPKKIHAVRGPKSRQRFLDLGIECPEVYGDPVLLLPKVYKPKVVTEKYKLGIVPHQRDQGHTWIKKYQNNPDIKIIDLANKNVWEVVDEICSCKMIASSSLHGIITADAYNIPSIWIEFSDKVIGKGFKFLDYFASVGREEKQPLVMSSETTLKELKSQFYSYEIKIDLEGLLASAPFEVNIIES